MDEGVDALVIATAERLFADLADLPLERAWPLIVDQGLPLMLVPEALGGLGLAAGTAAAVIAVSAASGLATPLGETVIANMVLGRAGIAPEGGAATLAGNATDRVAWATDAGRLLMEERAAPGVLVVATPGTADIGGTAASIDGSRRARVTAHATAARHALPGGEGALERCGAALRTIEMAGAACGALALTVEHVSTREQFGRSLSKFQAIQQELARMAGQVAALEGAAGLAAAFLDGPLTPSLALASAKARASEAAGLVASIAHQAHGAIGFTAQYRLGRFTRKLWSARAEFGGAAYWQDWIADVAFAAPADDLWSLVVAA